MAWNIPFEYILLAHEDTARGTAEAAPNVYLPLAGMITPQQEVYSPDESTGTLSAVHRDKVVRRWAEWSGDGPLDVNSVLYLLSMALRSVPTPSQPDGVNAPNTYLWEFARTMTSDDLKSATMWWGDPNVQVLQGVYGMVDEVSFTADATGTDGANMSANGRTQELTKVANPTPPARNYGPLISPLNMQLWIDTTQAIGTTAVTGRFLSAEVTIPTGVTYKFIASGPAAAKTYSSTGRQKTRASMAVRMEVPDMAQYDHFSNEDIVKMRVRMNGPISEDIQYYYVEFDIYGILTAPGWGEHEGSNRTLDFTVNTTYDVTLGSDVRVAVQNQIATLVT